MRVVPHTLLVFWDSALAMDFAGLKWYEGLMAPVHILVEGVDEGDGITTVHAVVCKVTMDPDALDRAPTAVPRPGKRPRERERDWAAQR